MFYQTDQYSVTVNHLQTYSELTLQMSQPILNTLLLPETYAILERYLPGVIKSRCFNEKKLPFAEELKATEIGHLFEHILLQYVLEKRISLGHTNFKIDARTYWKTQKGQNHIFQVIIENPRNYSEVFFEALKDSLHLLDLILKSYKSKVRTEIN